MGSPSVDWAALEPEVVRQVWAHVASTLTWPLLDDLVVEYDDRGLDFEEVLKHVTHAWASQGAGPKRVHLDRDALLSFPPSLQWLDPLPAALRLAYEHLLAKGPVYTDQLGKASLTAQDLLALCTSEAQVAHFRFFLDQCPHTFPLGPSSGSPDNIFLPIGLEGLRYGKVRTLEDCLDVLRSETRTAVGCPPSGKHLDLVHRIFDAAMEQGTWPQALPFVFTNLDLGFVPHLLKDLDEAGFLVSVIVEHRQSRLQLKGTCIPFCDPSGAFPEAVARVVRSLAVLWRRDPRAPQVSVPAVATEAGVEANVVSTVLLFLDADRVPFIEGMNVDQDLRPSSVSVGNDVRKFKSVESYDDYLAAAKAGLRDVASLNAMVPFAELVMDHFAPLEVQVVEASASPSEAIETLQNILVARATGQQADEEGYRELRNRLLSDERFANRLPRFIRTCRDLGQFWSFIKKEHAKYAQRREFIWQAFRPLLKEVDGPTPKAPADDDVASALEHFNLAHIKDYWQRALERRAADPPGAVTAARTLLEGVCKCILDERGVDYSDDVALPALYSLVAKQLNLAPSRETEPIVNQMLSGCISVVAGLAGIRNKAGDAHGRGRRQAQSDAQPRHAGLAVNLAGALALFLVETSKKEEELRSE